MEELNLTVQCFWSSLFRKKKLLKRSFPIRMYSLLQFKYCHVFRFSGLLSTMVLRLAIISGKVFNYGWKCQIIQAFNNIEKSEFRQRKEYLKERANSTGSFVSWWTPVKNCHLVKCNFTFLVDIASQSKNHLEVLRYNILAQ